MNKLLSVGLALVCSLIIPMFAMVSSVSAISDIDNHWAQDRINAMIMKSVVSVDSDGNFSPDDKISCAEFLEMLYKIDGGRAISHNVSTDVSDVVESDWFYEYVMWGIDKGIVRLYPGSSFSPNDEITREYMAVLTMHFIENNGIDYSYPYAANGGLGRQFADAGEISSYAYEAVFSLTRLAGNLLEGYKRVLPDEYPDNNYSEFVIRPKNTATRAEATTLIAKVYDAINKNPTPSVSPTVFPSISPLDSPSVSPSDSPLVSPSVSPSDSPLVSPSDSPFVSPSASAGA